MAKFKVGDRVVVSDKNGWWVRGTVEEVYPANHERSEGYGVRRDVTHDLWWAREGHFRYSIRPLIEQFELGDRVEFNSPNLITGTVVGIDPRYYHVRRDDGVTGTGFNKSWTITPESLRPLSTKTSQPSPQDAKQDVGKLKWDLLLAPFPLSLDAVLTVIEKGEERYGSGNTWKTIEPRRHKRAACRHLVASMRGESVNEADWGVQHLAQAVVNLLFALENELGAKK